MLRKIIPFVSVLLIIILVSLYYFHYKSEKHEVLLTEYKELAFNTHFKADRLTTWMNQFTSNAETYSFSPLLTSAFENYLKNHSVSLKKKIIKRFQIIKKFKKNENIIITDTFGNVHISLDTQVTNLDSFSICQLKKTLLFKRAVVGEIHQCQVTHKFCMDIMSPVVNESGIITGIMIIRLDPLKEIIPRLKIDKSTQEQSFLITRINNRNYILKDSTILPLIDKSTSDAILHHRDEYKGTDENQTIAHIESIKNTNWYLITQINYNDAIKKYNPYAKIILIVNGIIIFFLLISIVFLFQYRQKNIYNNLLRSEVAFQEEHERFRTTLYSISDGVLTTNESGFIVNMNKIASMLTEWSEKDARGKHVTAVFRIINEESRISAENPLMKVLNEGRVVGLSNHIILISRNGKEFPLTFSGSPIRNNIGQIIGSVLVFRDISNQKKNEIALRESEEKFKQTFLTIPDAVLINRMQDQIYVDVNESFSTLSGFSKEEVIGKTALDINIWNHPEDRKKLFGSLIRLGYCENLESQFRRKNGTIFTATISARKINLNGIQHIISIVHDITGRKKMEDELLIAKNKAEESDRLKTSFLQNISHEIRTPLNGIVGFANLLKKENIPDKEKSEYINIINKSSDQLLSIVDDILQISRIESGIVPLHKTTFDVNELMKQVYHLFLTKVNIDFSYNCGLDECFIENDKEKIKQILSVLINNAMKFTSTGEIQFEYKTYNDLMEFSVQDTGIGIPSEEQTKIFERFYQIDNDLTRKYGGNGLGLNIAKKLVELLNGKIWLDTEYKNGSRFCFSIPYKYSAPMANNKNMNYDFKNLTILVAEDEQTNLNFLKILLSMKGASVITANNGAEAVLSVQYNKTDLVLMDLKMPVMDGLEATRQIKKLFPDLPIIAQTAYSLQEEKEQALAAGCISFVTKPIRAEILFSEINYVLNKK